MERNIPRSAEGSGSRSNAPAVDLSSVVSESVLDRVRSTVSAGLNREDRDTNDCLTFFKGRARALAPFATAFLSDLAFSEMDDEIDLDDERDWVDEASDAFFVSLVFMGRRLSGLTGLEFLPWLYGSESSFSATKCQLNKLLE